MVSQDPATLKSCMSAYKQAWLDPVAKGQPDLYYNKGIVSTINYINPFHLFLFYYYIWENRTDRT